PTSMRNATRRRSSSTPGSAIFLSSPLKRSCRTLDAKSSILSAVYSGYVLPCSTTCLGIGARRLPPQSGQGTDDSGAAATFARSPSVLAAVRRGRRFLALPAGTTPAPSQAAHCPCLVLNENQRGSSSGTARPHWGQLEVMLNRSCLPFAQRSLTLPLPQVSARPSSASVRAPSACSSRTTRSMECSLLRV